MFKLRLRSTQIPPARRHRRRRGMALIMVLAALTVLTVMLTEVQDESSAELGSALSARDALIAEYSAKSAVNLSRHLITVGRETPTIRAVADVPAPSAIASTIRARSRCPAGSVEHRVQYSSIARSSSLRTSWDDGIRHHPTCQRTNDTRH